MGEPLATTTTCARAGAASATASTAQASQSWIGLKIKRIPGIAMSILKLSGGRTPSRRVYITGSSG
jgi:hypothetical protein